MTGEFDIQFNPEYISDYIYATEVENHINASWTDVTGFNDAQHNSTFHEVLGGFVELTEMVTTLGNILTKYL